MKRFWSPDDLSWLRVMYGELSAAECAAVLGRSVKSVQQKVTELRLQKSREWIAERSRQRTSVDPRCQRTQFRAGLVPWNKGTTFRAGGRSAETRFKAGRQPEENANYLPIGALRISKDGALERKVSDDPNVYPARRWVSVARLVWESAHGPIPAGHAVVFRPGMKTTVEADITLDRLELVSRADLMARNTIHRYPDDLKAAIRTVGRLRRVIAEQEKAAP